MNDVLCFDNPKKIRNVVINNEPWFCVEDIAKTKALYSANGKSLIDVAECCVSEKDKRHITMATPHGESQNVMVINRSGLYSLILNSEFMNEKEFEDLITSEILPVFRKFSNDEYNSYTEFILRLFWSDNIREIKDPCLSIPIEDVV